MTLVVFDDMKGVVETTKICKYVKINLHELYNIYHYDI